MAALRDLCLVPLKYSVMTTSTEPIYHWEFSASIMSFTPGVRLGGFVLQLIYNFLASAESYATESDCWISELRTSYKSLCEKS